MENPCSPLHRLAGDLRSHRLPSLGNSSPVGREHPHCCPGCSAQAATGSPPLRKSWSTCGAAPLNLHPEVCWCQLAEALCLLSGGAWAHRCSVQPCRGHRFLGLCQLRWGGPTFLAPLHSPRTTPASRSPGSLSPAGSAAVPWRWNPRIGGAPDAEVVPILLLLSVTTSGRRTPFLLPSSVCLQKSLHDSCGPLILTVDSVKPRAGHPAHLGRHARGVDLAAERSHRPV